MDRNGVATSILSLTTPGVWFGDAAEARRLARELNEHFAKVAAEHKGRYGHFAVLPMPDIDGSLAEIEYALDHLKADGIAFYTSYGNKHLGDATFAPVLEELNRRKALAYTHPCRPDCCAGLLPEITESAIEYGTDTTRTIASLVFSGAATRFPIYAGSSRMPAGPCRSSSAASSAWPRSPTQFARHLPDGVLPVLRRFYYDTAQVALPGPMASLMKLVQVSQVVFGTDYPFRNAADHVKGLGDCGFHRADEADGDRASERRAPDPASGTMTAPSREELLARAEALVPVLRERADELQTYRGAAPTRRSPISSKRASSASASRRAMAAMNMAGTCAARSARSLPAADGSQAWIHHILTDHSQKLGAFDVRAQDDVWGQDPDTRMAAGLDPVGKARRVPGGVIYSGRHGLLGAASITCNGSSAAATFSPTPSRRSAPASSCCRRTRRR